MSKENIKNLEVEYRVNLNYLDFINNLIENKVSLESENINLIKDLYSKEVNLKFNNIKRVDFRSLKRVEVKDNIKKFIEVEYKKSYKDFLNISSKLLELSNKNNLNSRYLKIDKINC